MNPLMQHMLFQQSGLPPGRRAKGYGASPLGAGGPHPVHQMNFMGRGGGMAGLDNNPFGAGGYPYPRVPMPMMMGGMGGMGGLSGMGNLGGGMGMNDINAMVLALLLNGGGNGLEEDWDEDEDEIDPFISAWKNSKRRVGLNSAAALMGMMGGGMRGSNLGAALPQLAALGIM